MSDLPKAVRIHEEGPREGFQIERASIATADKVRFIEALAETGVPQIDCISYVNPERVPGMRDAEAVAAAIRRRPGVRYTGLWLNTRGLERALRAPLDLVGAIRVTASETFSLKNTGMTIEQTFAEQRRWLAIYREHGIATEWGYVMTAFGCNFEREVPIAQVLRMVAGLLDLANEHGIGLKGVYLADTVGHGTPLSMERRIGAVRERWPDLRLGLHLHDTRGTGMANAYAALRLGVDQFDSSCAGLGGCPFAGHKGAAGNICTEDLVYMCHEMGIATGIDLAKLAACAQMAETIVGHPLPGKVMRSGAAAAAGSQH
ncbi:hydroxymethylglutaryl-CoA lyase [Chelatococcus reniformis]|uniref:Hydroxymethylglutaryl-CoA lyase n=1 Tax=Chelatococcus reniformis TaxID=1494448 RepID=A0A916UAF3_9HYPH|nr:hydroxymethylglutaryl-CoA lyase [Chelatococcus reniformis]GGC64979.1 hydroxymethylglutaryl-CoA lyase [Chelatococcus reniformis]